MVRALPKLAGDCVEAALVVLNQTGHSLKDGTRPEPEAQSDDCPPTDPCGEGVRSSAVQSSGVGCTQVAVVAISAGLAIG